MSKMIRWSPMREMDRMMNDLASAFSLDTTHPFAKPALDIIDRENEVEVQINLPGVNPDDVNIEIKDGILTIATSVKTDETREEARYTYRERFTGSYQRSLRVPDTIDVEHTEANFENGVLTLIMPKKPEAQPIRIQVNGSGTKAIENGSK